MEKILLTGATGFIGSNILNEISKNNKVFIIVRGKLVKKQIRKKNIILIKFNDYEKLNLELKKIRVDTVIHCATHYIKQHSYSDIKKLINSNILLGNIILENLENMKVKKFINFSTVWQNPKNTGGKFVNLYAAYKSSFYRIYEYYRTSYKKINFFELLISDTFGFGDNREKLIVTLKRNFKRNKTTKLISKNLYINLLNVKDINSAILILLKKTIKPGQYVLKNSQNFKVSDIIKIFNLQNHNKIKVKWLQKKIIKNQFYRCNKIKTWKPKESNISDIINYIASSKF